MKRAREGQNESKKGTHGDTCQVGIWGGGADDEVYESELSKTRSKNPQYRQDLESYIHLRILLHFLNGDDEDDVYFLPILIGGILSNLIIHVFLLRFLPPWKSFAFKRQQICTQESVHRCR